VLISAIKGRARLRSENFKDPSLSLSEIRKVPGVEEATHNPDTGSILIKYDPLILNPEKAMELLEKIDPGVLRAYEELEKNRGGKSFFESLLKGILPDLSPKDSPWNDAIGLTFALLTLVISGFAGSKKIHVMIGLFFLERVVKHLFRYRSRIKPPKKSFLSNLLIPRGPKGPKGGAPGKTPPVAVL
jgi:hypothetical protein